MRNMKYRLLTLRMKIRFRLWVWKTNIKELYYKLYDVPEWHLEDIHEDIEAYIEEYMWTEENDLHNGRTELVIDMHEQERIANGMPPQEANIPMDKVETRCTPTPGFPPGHDEGRYIGSMCLGEIEIDLEHCERYSAMSPSEHEAYVEWCGENNEDQPSKHHCIYVSSMATIHVYIKQPR